MSLFLVVRFSLPSLSYFLRIKEAWRDYGNYAYIGVDLNTTNASISPLLRFGIGNDGPAMMGVLFVIFLPWQSNSGVGGSYLISAKCATRQSLVSVNGSANGRVGGGGIKLFKWLRSCVAWIAMDWVFKLLELD